MRVCKRRKLMRQKIDLSDKFSGPDDSNEDPEFVPNSTNETGSLQNSNSKNANNSRKSKSLNNTDEKVPKLDLRFLQVPPSKENSKKDFCIYCKKLISKLGRHLENVHKEEDNVKRFVAYPRNSKTRKSLINNIRKKGNYLHNTKSNFNTGILIPCRRRQNRLQKTSEDYTVCSYCKGTFSKLTIRLHYKSCNPNHKNGSKDCFTTSRQFMPNVHPLAGEVLRKDVMPVLKDDKITKQIRYDKLIIIMGNKLCEKYTPKHQHDMIRSHLRLLGRLKLALLESNKEITELSFLFRPQNYDHFIKAVRDCAGYNVKTRLFKSPSVASNLGTLIKKCANTWIAECIKSQNVDMKKDTENFLILYENDFPTAVNKAVMENQLQHKISKKEIIPSNSDKFIFLFKRYM